jgi:hypothetical protein
MKPKKGTINVKTTLLGLAIATTLGASPVQAAFLAPGSSGSITVTGGCFAFVDVCEIGGIGTIFDDYKNTTGGVGSGVTGNARIGQMNFTVGPDGNTFQLTSYELDTYPFTAAGDINTRIVDFSVAGGFISDTGDIILDLTGRTAITQLFPGLGENPWNIDDSPFAAGTTGLQELHTTGFDDADDPAMPGRQSHLAQTGSLLVGGGGTWTGTLVSSGNIGQAWGPFSGTPYRKNTPSP